MYQDQGFTNDRTVHTHDHLQPRAEPLLPVPAGNKSTSFNPVVKSRTTEQPTQEGTCDCGRCPGELYKKAQFPRSSGGLNKA